ncbi:type II restriction endonuclease [Janthinobacterium sp. SUN100]|uniref:type II restriction endonuclease n=1 Tax=Janthinobacterium sp. SUN100 TaxID=3004101 RepID=UPI0025B1E600|nr:type II restriction endonuclease [Janthinobacterium sp. SUN100]MDN2701217.1 type II restriction endonuclease [Janthinobacterium sp. SUN100]
MKPGYLSEYFQGVALKRLSKVEADILCSNQHEFNGVEGLRSLLGEPEGKVRYPADIMYLSDEEEQVILEEAVFTWYDSRQKARLARGVQRWEYRLYFPTSRASGLAATGDLLVIAKQRNGKLLVIVAEKGSGIGRQIEWLFGTSNLDQPGFFVKSGMEEQRDRIEFTSRIILESIGFVVETTAPAYLETMLQKFGGKFPTTREFSTYARSTLPHIDPKGCPDDVLMAWMEQEEILFRTLEAHLISERLTGGFGKIATGVDVEGFLKFSLSVQNRRKSRVGLAFENHLELLFVENGLRYSRTAVTENKAKPDFLFPGASEYHDHDFASDRLTMLGVKSTCKDRWRQVLAEADRVQQKHLITLEPAISQQQTDEMASKNLQLIIPEQLHQSYSLAQRESLMSLSSFIQLLHQRQ